jgi:hypothetical protein
VLKFIGGTSPVLIGIWAGMAVDYYFFKRPLFNAYDKHIEFLKQHNEYIKRR